VNKTSVTDECEAVTVIDTQSGDEAKAGDSTYDSKIKLRVLQRLRQRQTSPKRRLIQQRRRFQDIGLTRSSQCGYAGNETSVTDECEAVTVVDTQSGDEAKAGDSTYDSKIKLIVTGVAEAATAANFAKTTIDPTAKAFPGHSSDMK
jgi:hypothetical protein